MINLRNMLVGDLTRLRYVDRFSTCHKVHNENVAEHTFYVAMYTMLICDDLKCVGEVRYIALRKAMLHDIEECITGDINRIFKHSTPEILSAVNEGAFFAVNTLFGGITSDYKAATKYITDWKESKNATEAGSIVKFADYLAVLAYMIQELTNANITMRQHWTTMLEYHQLFRSAEFDFLRPLVDEAYCMLTEAFEKTEG